LTATVQNDVYYLKPDGEHVALDLRIGDVIPIVAVVQFITKDGELQVWVEDVLVALIGNGKVRTWQIPN
jgi:hypothetical protein